MDVIPLPRVRHRAARGNIPQVNDEPHPGVLPTFDDVEAAAGRLAGIVRRTPLLAGTPLDELTGGRVLLKLESLQRTGSFKIRGAYNRLVQLGPDERAAGVVAYLLRQSRPGRRLRRGHARHPRHDRDAIRRAARKTRGHARARRRHRPYDRDRESREAIASKLAVGARRDAGAGLRRSACDRGPGDGGAAS